jgi:hypothetical protein
MRNNLDCFNTLVIEKFQVTDSKLFDYALCITEQYEIQLKDSNQNVSLDTIKLPKVDVIDNFAIGGYHIF